MDNNSFKMDERKDKGGSFQKSCSTGSLLGQFVKKTSLIMSQVADNFEPSAELSKAVNNGDIAVIRYKDGYLNNDFPYLHIKPYTPTLFIMLML